MKLPLNVISVKSPRVRTSQSPEELDALAASIAALGGVIVPVGVRPIPNNGWELVYGHRRVAAAKQAGLKYIEAIEVNPDDDMVKVYALTENVVREGMTAMDIAKALQQIKDESGWTEAKVGEFFGRSYKWVNAHLQLLEPEVVKAIGNSTRVEFGAAHLNEVKAGLGSHKELVPALIKKVVEDGLSTRQAHQVAESAAEAFDQFGEKGLKAVLDQDYLASNEALPASEVIKPQFHAPSKKIDQKGMISVLVSGLKALIKTANKLNPSPLYKASRPEIIKLIKQLLKIVEEKGG